MFSSVSKSVYTLQPVVQPVVNTASVCEIGLMLLTGDTGHAADESLHVSWFY